MHPNPAFRKTPHARNIAFARERGFGVLSVNHDDGPLLSHVPVRLQEDGGWADIHLVRSNPILRALPAKAAVAISGPDAYISPDWYGVPDQVPTWNYVAVHLRGRLEVRPQDEMRAMLDRQSAHFEQMLPKPEWTAAKMTSEVLDRMMRQIVPCRLHVEAIDGTWKLGQNKPDDVRVRAATQVAGLSVGHEVKLLAALMHGPFTD